MTKRYLAIPAAALALALGATSARAAEPTTAELMQKIDQLQNKVQQLETQQATTDSKVVDQTVARVLKDADKRSQLMQLEGFTAGYNNGRFMLGSADGQFTLMPMLILQVRNATNIDTSGDDNTENGFNLPNVYFGIDGNAFKDWSYQLLWNSASGSMTLECAWVKYAFADQLGVRAGQFVDPVFHEQLTGADHQMAADRTMLNQIITGAEQSFTQGVTLVYTPTDQVSIEAGFTDGVNTGNTSFRDFPNAPTNFGFAGRAEFTAMGNKAAYRDFTALKNSEDLLVIGIGGDWTQSGDTNNLLHTLDIQWENSTGLSIYGAYVGQFINNGSGTGLTGVTGGTEDKFNWGFIAQLGYCFNENWEVFGRYDYTHLDDEIAIGTGGESEDNLHELTGGVNYYFHGHNAKLTVDLTYLPQGAPAGLTNLGILTSDDDEFVIRGQLQLAL